MTVVDHTAIELPHVYAFRVTDTRSLRLPPRGMLRIVRTRLVRHTPMRPGVKSPTSASRAHALRPRQLFSSLLQAPHYQELVLTHYALPAPGKHGPFNVHELSPADFREIDRATFLERIENHLAYRRYHAPALDETLKARVVAFVAGLAEPVLNVYRLAPCEWFSAPDNLVHPHEWSHALLEFHEYVLFDTRRSELICVMLAFD